MKTFSVFRVPGIAERVSQTHNMNCCVQIIYIRETDLFLVIWTHSLDSFLSEYISKFLFIQKMLSRSKYSAMKITDDMTSLTFFHIRIGQTIFFKGIALGFSFSVLVALLVSLMSIRVMTAFNICYLLKSKKIIRKQILPPLAIWDFGYMLEISLYKRPFAIILKATKISDQNSRQQVEKP